MLHGGQGEKGPARVHGSGQECLPGLSGTPAQARARLTSPQTPAAVSAPPPVPVECAVGCRGTEACLCGQGELSDFPVWIEND